MNQLKVNELNVVSGIAINEEFKSTKDGKIIFEYQDGILEVISNIVDSNHEYYYSNKTHSISQSLGEQLSVYFMTRGELKLEIAVTFLDSAGNKISVSMVSSNKVVQLSLPVGASSYRLGLRVASSGVAYISCVIIGVDLLIDQHLKSLKLPAVSQIELDTAKGLVRVNSKLMDKQHEYFYFNALFLKDDYCVLNNLAVFSSVDAIGVLALLAVVFYDENKVKLSAENFSVNIVNMLKIPDNCVYFKIGYRLAGSGKVIVKQLLLGEAINGALLSDEIKIAKTRPVKLNNLDGTLKIISRLETGQHSYVYSHQRNFLVPHSEYNAAQVYMETTPSSLLLNSVVSYLDSNDERIETVVLRTNRRAWLDVPNNAEYIKNGLRVSGSGEGYIKSLQLELVNSIEAKKNVEDIREEKLRSEFYQFSGIELKKEFSVIVGKPVELDVVDNQLQVKSNVLAGKSEYIYSSQIHSITDLKIKLNGKLYFDISSGSNVTLVLESMNENDRNIGLDVFVANKYHMLNLKPEAKKIKLWLRVSGVGETLIRALAIETV